MTQLNQWVLINPDGKIYFGSINQNEPIMEDSTIVVKTEENQDPDPVINKIRKERRALR